MKILRFPDPRCRGLDVATRIAQVERLLTDLRLRQTTAREDGRRLRLSLERLGLLLQDLSLGTERLRRSARRLGGADQKMGPPSLQT